MQLSAEQNNFIYAKGEMANRTRTFDWSATTVGSIANWPASLLTTVNLILDSSFPMFIMWGPEKIQFYNDAYLKIMGTAENGKHPYALGQKAEDYWPESWSIIGPLLNGVMETGESVYLEDQLIPIYRNGNLDDVYWTFSYNPIRGSNGKPDGILIVCTETTKTNQLLLENEQQLQRVLDHMAEGVGITDINGKILYANPMAHQILNTEAGRFPEHTGNSTEWFNMHLDDSPMADHDHPVTVAITTGKPVFDFEFYITQPGIDRKYLRMNAAPIIDKNGNVSGSVSMFTDNTRRRVTEGELKYAKEESEQQRRLYETITSATPDLIYVFDLDYRFTYANKALLDMWGKTWDTAVGKGLRENGYEEWHAAMHEREIDYIAATHESVRGEVAFPHATLGRRIYDYILNPVIDESGKVVAIAGTTRDITDIKNAEAAIAESEERFRTMAEGSGILIAVTDENGNSTYFSKAWEHLTGRPTAQMLKSGWIDLLYPDDQKRYTDTYLAAFEKREPFTCEFRVLTKEGDYRWLLANSPPLFRPDGSFAGYVTACLDITEQKQDEQRKNDFISMVSHELKTPLTSAISYVQVLHKKAQTSGETVGAGMLDRTGKQLAKMARMINGFLNVSRLESGKIHIDQKRFDMALLIKESEEESLAAVSTHKVLFAPVTETWVNADWEKVGQVIDNLISNAVKYSPPNSTIRVACVTKDGKARVSISDEGVGISKDDLPKLFERFYRVKDKEYKNVSGFGIGLYLCCEIIKRHGGNIWAESEPGQGSTFFFELPLAE